MIGAPQLRVHGASSRPLLALPVLALQRIVFVISSFDAGAAERVARLPGTTALRRDEDHAVRRARAVDRRRRRTL